MDKEIEKRRAINYLSDLVIKLTALETGNTKLFYDQVYQNFVEAKQYLITSSLAIGIEIELENLPNLVRPNIFNRELGAIWTISILGLVNPFMTILILIVSFPVSFPYLIVRTIIVRQTKLKVERARIELTGILNRLKEKE